jgi:hypothetical protein
MALIVGAILALLAISFAAPVLFTPSSEEVVEAFRGVGLEVGKSYPVRREPGWEESSVADSFVEGTRFEIPSLGRDAGGRVFVCGSRDELEMMRSYYLNIEVFFGPSHHSHLYDEGLVLLQINGHLPEAQADRYGSVLEEAV